MGKAARGVDGRVYPWGNQWLEDHCNSKESGIGRTSSVGHFAPNGISVYECMDMSGNVNEWADTPHDEDAGALKGGSWKYDYHNCRVDLRDVIYSNYCDSDIGFRLCCPIVSGY